MEALQTYNFNQNAVRTMLLNNEPWFVGKDVADALGYKDTSDALKRHVDEDDKGVGVLPTPGGIQQVIIVNESGVYSLVFGSKLPEAKKFKRWVTTEVLPTIRRTGSFQMITDPLQLLQLQYQVIEKHDRELKDVDYRLDDVEVNQRLPWRDQMMLLVHRGCDQTGLPRTVFLGKKVYPELERRTGRSLGRTLIQRKKRMKEQGARYKTVKLFCKIDLIESEKKLREVFEQVLKETVERG